MEKCNGEEVSILGLEQGEEYFAVSTSTLTSSCFKGLFSEYWVNEAGYSMVRFHYSRVQHENCGYTSYIGSRETHPVRI